MTVGSLFSGIGGLDLGLERAGMTVKWQCEIDPYCRSVLAHHWPDVPIYEDIHDIQGATPYVDLIAGGFPCQPVSQAAARTERGGGWLWPEMRRVVELLKPQWVIVENVEGLRYANRGLSEVLSDLAALGFDAEWRVIRASDLGAPHRRARIWLVAHSNAYGESTLTVDEEASFLSEPPSPISRWRTLPDLRVAHGVRSRVLRRERVGNAVVPQVSEFVGRCIMEAAA